MGDILELIKARRSIRRYEDRPIADEDLLKIVEAGRWAPSGSNRQPCVFVLVDDRDAIETLSAFSPGVIGRAAAVVAVCVDDSRRLANDRGSESLDPMDVAMAAQNMLLEAASLGIGSCPVLSFDGKSVARVLGLPGHVRPLLLVTLGYALGPAKAPARRPLSEILHRNRWGEAFTK